MQPKFPPSRGPLPGPSYQPPSNPPIPAQGQPGSASIAGRASGSVTADNGGLQTSNQYLRIPIVRYSSKMRVGKQHPMRISLTGANGEADLVKPQSLSGGFDPPIVIQVTIPGALVTPAHQIIPLSGGDANFIIQPISSGKLKGAKVEFLSQGRKISEIPLPIRANKGSLAKWLLLLGILLPLLINLMPELIYQDRLLPMAEPVRRGQMTVTDSLNSLTVPLPAPLKNQNNGEAGKNPPAKKTPEKSLEKTPGKSLEKTNEKTPGKPSALLMDFNQLHYLMSELLVAVQPPVTNRVTRNTSAFDIKSVDPSGQVEIPAKKQPDVGKAETSNPETSGSNAINNRFVIYRGENAIGAWIRHKVNLNGYATSSVSPDLNDNEFSRFFSVSREYQITGETSKEWTLSRVGAMGLYYLEPVIRWLHRVFIQFPRDIPFADLGFGLFFITLSIIVWVLTSPNRKKIKGSIMDIRLAN